MDGQVDSGSLAALHRSCDLDRSRFFQSRVAILTSSWHRGGAIAGLSKCSCMRHQCLSCMLARTSAELLFQQRMHFTLRKPFISTSAALRSFLAWLQLQLLFNRMHSRVQTFFSVRDCMVVIGKRALLARAKIRSSIACALGQADFGEAGSVGRAICPLPRLPVNNVLAWFQCGEGSPPRPRSSLSHAQCFFIHLRPASSRDIIRLRLRQRDDRAELWCRNRGTASAMTSFFFCCSPWSSFLHPAARSALRTGEVRCVTHTLHHRWRLRDSGL